MKNTAILLFVLSIAACDRSHTADVAAADGRPTAEAPQASGPPSETPTGSPAAAGATNDFTTPEQAAALAGSNNQNMAEAQAYLAAHPAALARRHQICDHTPMAASDRPRALGIYCNEMEGADIAAPRRGVDDTSHL
jgi:hypothetical protein